MVQVLSSISLADMISALAPIVGNDVINSLAEYEIISLYNMMFNPFGSTDPNVPNNGGGSDSNGGGGSGTPIPETPVTQPLPTQPVVSNNPVPDTPSAPVTTTPVVDIPVAPTTPVTPSPITPVPLPPASTPALQTSVLSLNNAHPDFPSSDPNTISDALAGIFPEVRNIPPLYAAQHQFSSIIQQYVDGRDAQIFSILQAQIDALVAQLNGITVVKG